VKLAIQERLVPGDTLADKAALAEDLGFAGMEFWGSGIVDRVKEIAGAFKGRKIKPCTICAGLEGSLISADAEKRKTAREQLVANLKAAGELGMVGQILVPGFTWDQNMPDLSPYKTARELEMDLLVAQLEQVAPEAERAGSIVLLEALNRYETRFLNRQMDAVELARRIDSPAVQIMCDFFHMNIEEPDTPRTLREVGSYCKHVHLADNTRTEPGTGDIDFAAGLAALKQIGFEGYMALECRLSDPADPKTCLQKCVEYLRRCI